MDATLRRWLKSWSLFDIIKYVEEFFSKWVITKWFILGHFFGEPLAKPLVRTCRDFLDMSGISGNFGNFLGHRELFRGAQVV